MIHPDDASAMARALYGQHATKVPAWCWVQHQGDDCVSFVGASSYQTPHPMRYGSDRTHQLILGEIIVRPSLIIATDAVRGHGLDGLAVGSWSRLRYDGLIAEGELLLGDEAHARRLLG